MRKDWLPVSASALVIGAMALVLGALINPTSGNQDAGGTLRIVENSSGRWLGMALMYFIGSIALCLGLPALLSLFVARARRLGVVATAVFAVGAIGLSGYASLLVFFRALVENDALRHPTGGTLDSVTHDAGLSTFLYGWIGAFYLGVVLVGIALFVARATPRWVPGALLVFLLMLPIVGDLGRLGMAIQTMALAVAFTGVAMAAVSAEQQRSLVAQPVFY